MSISLSGLRSIYGPCYISETPDGQFIPWKPLSIGEWLEYTDLHNSGRYAPSVLENEIFKHCVLDSYIIKEIDKQKAGTITTIVSHILQQSGPQNINEFNTHLNYCRHLAQQPIHQIVSIICQVFVAYKPEDVYQLDYETLLLRLAQAEERMMKMGLKTEPFALTDVNDINEPQKPKYNPDKLKEAYEQLHQKPASPKKSITQENINPKNNDKVKNGNIVITKEQLQERFATGADMEDLCLMEHQMMQDASIIYKDYLDDAKSGKQVKIKTVEERLKAPQKTKLRPSKLKQQGK